MTMATTTPGRLVSHCFAGTSKFVRLGLDWPAGPIRPNQVPILRPMDELVSINTEGRR